MKVIVILEVDEEKVLHSAYGEDNTDPETTVGGATEIELGWVEQSGIIVVEVIESDELSSNDQTLGSQVRKYLNK